MTCESQPGREVLPNKKFFVREITNERGQQLLNGDHMTVGSKIKQHDVAVEQKNSCWPGKQCHATSPATKEAKRNQSVQDHHQHFVIIIVIQG
jgi:hypothetical protein